MRRARGFSMIELMVGIVLTLLVVTIVMQALALYENQKRVTSGSSDSATNGMIALFQIKREARMAGFGLTSPASCFARKASTSTTTARRFSTAAR